MFKLAPSVKIAINLLNSNGYEVYIVGGSVRDLLLEKNPKDWDLTTNALPIEMKKVFADFSVYETGISFGTLMVGINGDFLEITTYRIDGTYENHRKPKNVTFTPNLIEDLARRDFTINAMAYHPKLGLQDPFNGKEALEHKQIIAVGNPSLRFKEDALRILRAMRFAATLNFKIEKTTAIAMKDNAKWLLDIAKERILVELKKMLCAKAIVPVLRANCHVLFTLFPVLAPMEGFEQHHPYHCFDVWEHTLHVLKNTPPILTIRFAALLHDSGKPTAFTMDENGISHFRGHPTISEEIARKILIEIKLDKKTSERVLFLVKHHDIPLKEDIIFIKRKLHDFGVEAFRELLLLMRADNSGKNPNKMKPQSYFDNLENIVTNIVNSNSCYSLKNLSINGNDLIKLGLHGKKVGKYLNLVLEKVIEDELPNNKEALLLWLKEFMHTEDTL